jgi:GxxExxY protein
MLYGDESLNRISGMIVSSCYEVHNELGPGLLESIYADCLGLEFSVRGLAFEREKPVPVIYKGNLATEAFRPDFYVEGLIVVELKAVEKILPVHNAQLMTYLKLARSPLGLLVNFNVVHLNDGIKRIIMK